MSTQRVGLSAWQWDKKYGVEYGPNGFRLCRLCKTETTYKRATLCSETCRERWAVMTSPGYARQLVYQRDKGVCARCGLDTDLLSRHIQAPGQEYSKLPYKDRPRSRCQSFGRYYGHPLLRSRVSLWDADHIIPVVEGGGECGLENLRTLCLWCHKQATADLASRRAREKMLANFESKRAAAIQKYGLPGVQQLSLLEPATGDSAARKERAS